MKRFHVHIAVKDLATSITFYSRLFGQAPAKQKLDYAKWMLDDPSVNFAISARGHALGVNHFGMQVDTEEELANLKLLADSASGNTTQDQGEVACCYAKSEKHWTFDPQGVAWEHFITLADTVTFSQGAATPAAVTKPSSCCPSQTISSGQQHCCG